MKFLDEEGLEYFWNIMKNHIIFNGICTTNSNVPVKQVTMSPILLKKGSDPIPENVQIRVKFINQNTVIGPTLRVDGSDYAYPIEDPNGLLITPNQIASLSGICTFVFQKTGNAVSEGKWVLFQTEKALVDRIYYSESDPPPVENRFEGMIWLKKKEYIEPSDATPSDQTPSDNQNPSDDPASTEEQSSSDDQNDSSSDQNENP